MFPEPRTEKDEEDAAFFAIIVHDVVRERGAVARSMSDDAVDLHISS
jgi:hypothetical protein